MKNLIIILIIAGLCFLSCGVVVLQSDFDEYKAQNDYRQARLTEYSIQLARNQITIDDYERYVKHLNMLYEATK